MLPFEKSTKKYKFVSILIFYLWFSPLIINAQDRAINRKSDKTNRFALIIGNSDYEYTGKLKNPLNDARAMSNILKKLGFYVELVLDGNKKVIEKKIEDFGSSLRSNRGVGLFYYAGHGVQFGGENYLIPVEANPQVASDLRYEAVALGRLLNQLKESNNETNLILLDACRNNPFASTRSLGTRGLAQITASQGTFISYATSPGNVAEDGVGQNSTYTSSLLKQIALPDQKIEDIFKQVGKEVSDKTNGKQIPWIASSLTTDFYFVRSGSTLSLDQPSEQFTSSGQDFFEEFNHDSLLEDKHSVYLGFSLNSGEGEGLSLGYIHSSDFGIQILQYQNIDQPFGTRNGNIINAKGSADGYSLTYRGYYYDNYFMFGLGILRSDNIKLSGGGSTSIEGGLLKLIGYMYPLNNSLSILFNAIQVDYRFPHETHQKDNSYSIDTRIRQNGILHLAIALNL